MKKLRIFAVPFKTEWQYKNIAEIAQLVERNLAKVEVAGPSPVFRSKAPLKVISEAFFMSFQVLFVLVLV